MILSSVLFLSKKKGKTIKNVRKVRIGSGQQRTPQQSIRELQVHRK
jgi:hypothetical protein